MKLKEENEVRWITTPDSHKAHIGLPANEEFEVRKHNGRFILKSDIVSIPTFIYPIGVSTNLAKVMEDEYTLNKHKIDEHIHEGKFY